MPEEGNKWMKAKKLKLSPDSAEVLVKEEAPWIL